MNAYYETSLFILQEIICLLSSIGSLMIISQVSRSKFNRTKPQQRLVLGMSVSDLVLSMTWVFTPLLMPPDDGKKTYWANGNQGSCSYQGFMVTLFITAGVLYQCSLQLQYLLTIKHGWSQYRIRKIEVYMHAVPWGFGLVSAITNLILRNYNPANWDCWIAPLPSNCTYTFEINRGRSELTETDCVRGDNASLYQWVFFFGPLWICGAFCCFVMHQVYTHVYTTENKMRRYGVSADAELKMTMQVKSQALFYAKAFLFVWTFPTISRLIQIFGELHPIMIVLSGATISSQGIWNAIIYFRPRFKQCDAELNAYRKVLRLMNSTLCFWSCKAKYDYINDVKDVVAYVDVGDGKAVEVGQESSTQIPPLTTTTTPPSEKRTTWGQSVRRILLPGATRPSDQPSTSRSSLPAISTTDLTSTRASF